MSVCLNAVPPWPPWSSKGSPECVNCGRPIRETGGGSALRRYVHVPQRELDQAAEFRRAAVAGSPGDLYDPPRPPDPEHLAEVARRADELLALENNGITDSWRES